MQGRFGAKVVDGDAYLLALSRYIHLNPVRAGIVKSPDGYRYSSYNFFIFPWQLLLLVLIVVLIAIFLFIFIVKKWDEHIVKRFEAIENQQKPGNVEVSK